LFVENFNLPWRSARGAFGYLLKNTLASRLLEPVKYVADGGWPGPDLTPHETRILKLLVDGHNYKTASRN
jgi:hypothetical protein